jgi:LacI family transcriptional regulator
MQGASNHQRPDRRLSSRAAFELLSDTSTTGTMTHSRSLALAERHRHETGDRRLIGVAMNFDLRQLTADSAPTLSHPFFDDVLFGIRARADAGELDLLLLTGVSSDITGEETHYAELCHRHGAEGIIVVSFRPDEPELAALVASAFPCVAIDIQLIGPRATFVSSDNVGGAIDAVRYLRALGRTKIAFIGGWGSAPASVDRRLGYESALRELGLEQREEYVVEGDWRHDRAREMTRKMLALSDPPDAVFCASDVMAIGAMVAIEDAGLRVPEDIAIVGFDDSDLARVVSPSLTSVRQDQIGLGTAAVEVMLRMLDDPGASPPVSILPTELRIGESTDSGTTNRSEPETGEKDVLYEASARRASAVERLSAETVYRKLGDVLVDTRRTAADPASSGIHEVWEPEKRRLVAIALDNCPDQSFRHALFDEIFLGIRALAHLSDIDLLVLTNVGTIPGQPYPPLLELCRKRRADGAIIVALEPSDPSFIRLVESGFPCVLFDIDVLSNNVAFVMSDNVDGATKIMRHLGELGKKRIAFIGGRGQERPHVDRHFAYQSELARLGLEYRSQYVASAHWFPEPAYEAMQRMLALPEPPDAVFCASDVMAIAAMAAIEEAGLRVPEDIAVAGFDDIDYAHLVTPALTTVRQDRSKMVTAIMDALQQLLEHPQSPPPVSLLPIELIVRESTVSRQDTVGDADLTSTTSH